MCFGILLEYINGLVKNLLEFIILIIIWGWSIEVGLVFYGIVVCMFF